MQNTSSELYIKDKATMEGQNKTNT